MDRITKFTLEILENDLACVRCDTIYHLSIKMCCSENAHDEDKLICLNRMIDESSKAHEMMKKEKPKV